MSVHTPAQQLLVEIYQSITNPNGTSDEQLPNGTQVEYAIHGIDGTARPPVQGTIEASQNFARGQQTIRRYKILNGPWINHKDVTKVLAGEDVEGKPLDTGTMPAAAKMGGGPGTAMETSKPKTSDKSVPSSKYPLLDEWIKVNKHKVDQLMQIMASQHKPFKTVDAMVVDLIDDVIDVWIETQDYKEPHTPPAKPVPQK